MYIYIYTHKCCVYMYVNIYNNNTYIYVLTVYNKKSIFNSIQLES